MTGNNTVQLIGYVGNHLRVYKRGDKKKVLIRVATHERKKNDGGEPHYITTWHDVAAWGNMAIHAENSFVKGSRILVQGRLVYHTYLDQAGHMRYVTEILAENLVNLDR